MSGTIAGGKKAVRTIKKKHGQDHYVKIGAIGGKAGRTGGFYANRSLAKTAGQRGGLVSSYAKNKPSLAVRRRRATLKTKDPFADLFTDSREEFSDGFGRSTWYDKVANWLRRSNG